MFDKRTLIGSSLIPLRFIFFMWLLFVLDNVYGYQLNLFGIVPRTLHGLLGVITAPFIHAGPIHILSNSIPLLFLGVTIFFNYPKIAKQVFYGCYFITNLLVWLLGRPYPHIGASGLVYGLAAFAISLGLFRRDLKSLAISVVVMVLYGSIFIGIIPANEWISWESHLFGALVGFLLAGYYARQKRLT